MRVFNKQGVPLHFVRSVTLNGATQLGWGTKLIDRRFAQGRRVLIQRLIELVFLVGGERVVPVLLEVDCFLLAN